MIYTARTKKKFIELVHNFTEPVLIRGTVDLVYNLQNCFWVVHDKANFGISVQLIGTRLSEHESLNEHYSIDKYYEKERLRSIKYENWMYDVFGEYYEQQYGSTS